MIFSIQTPEETALALAEKLRTLRLVKKWKRTTLAARSGVSAASLRRFEQTGRISLNHFLKLVHALGRLDEFDTLLRAPEAKSLKELKQTAAKIPKRGRI